MFGGEFGTIRRWQAEFFSEAIRYEALVDAISGKNGPDAK